MINLIQRANARNRYPSLLRTRLVRAGWVAMIVPTAIAQTIGKLIPRLASDHDGEVVATARAIERLLKAGGRDWHDLAASVCVTVRQIPVSDWGREAAFCADHASELNERELDFISTIVRRSEIPTPKQLRWLCDIGARLRGVRQPRRP
jgi:hypothetical protein